MQNQKDKNLIGRAIFCLAMGIPALTIALSKNWRGTIFVLIPLVGIVTSLTCAFLLFHRYLVFQRKHHDSE